MPALPVNITPPIDLGTPGSRLQLYSGNIKVIQGEKVCEAPGEILLNWLPMPHKEVIITMAAGDDTEMTFEHGGVKLQLEDNTELKLDSERLWLVEEDSSSPDSRGIKRLHGVLDNKPVVREPDRQSKFVTFVVPNFNNVFDQRDHPEVGTSQLVLATDEWRIVLKKVLNYTSTEDFLKYQSFCAITHVGRLERTDDQEFTHAEVKDILDSLFFYLSFACGRFTGPCLPHGFDTNGTPAWTSWSIPHIEPFQKRSFWAENYIHFEGPFRGFYRLWKEDSKFWPEVIQEAITWYVLANGQAGLIEGAIILTQTALELLSSAIVGEYIHDNENGIAVGKDPKDNWNSLSAAKRIHALMEKANIPTTPIPPELRDLCLLAADDTKHKLCRNGKREKWPDVATAMVGIRNSIAHPERENRELYSSHSSKARRDVWKLGLWVLEMCLLRLFSHTGNYYNRLKPLSPDKCERVPWSNDLNAGLSGWPADKDCAEPVLD